MPVRTTHGVGGPVRPYLPPGTRTKIVHNRGTLGQAYYSRTRTTTRLRAEPGPAAPHCSRSAPHIGGRVDGGSARRSRRRFGPEHKIRVRCGKAGRQAIESATKKP